MCETTTTVYGYTFSCLLIDSELYVRMFIVAAAVEGLDQVSSVRALRLRGRLRDRTLLVCTLLSQRPPPTEFTCCLMRERLRLRHRKNACNHALLLAPPRDNFR